MHGVKPHVLLEDLNKMKDVTPIIRRMNTPESKTLWKSIEKASKEVDKWPEWMKPKAPQPIQRYDLNSDKVVIKHKSLRNRIAALLVKHKALTTKASEIWQKQYELLKQMQSKCKHELVLERKTSWRDEYDDWREGYPERKCIDCFLEEKSNHDGYKKLAKSTVIDLITKDGDKIFSLEFEDLNP
jgi:hypothetical protein